MKKIYISILLIICFSTMLFQCYAEDRIWFCSNEGNHVSMEKSRLDSISFVDPNAFELSVYNKILKSEGGSFTLNITANQAWIAETNNPIAISLSKSTGVGSDEIVITAMENDNKGSYSAIVTVTLLNGEYKQLIITVYDKDNSNKKVSPEKIYMPYTGGEEELSIYTKRPWKATVSDPTAISLSKKSGQGNEVIVVKGINNTENKPFSAIITIEFEDGSKTDVPISVSTADCRIVVSPSNINIPLNGGKFDVKVHSNSTWSAKNNKSWIKLSKYDGEYDDIVSVYVEPSFNNQPTDASISFEAAYSRNMISGICYYSLNYYKYKSEVRVVRADTFAVSPSNVVIDCEGGDVNVTLLSLSEWTAYANRDWVEITPSGGLGNKDVKIKVRGTQSFQDVATVIFKSKSGGQETSMSIVRRGYFTKEGEMMSDCQGNRYKTIWINGYNIMAENLKCSKYDTESEAYKDGIYDINASAFSAHTYTPAYIDDTDNSNWTTSSYSRNLTELQIAKLGYLYNWAAAVGVADGEKQTTEFMGNRQGICPNGWHLPSQQEFKYLLSISGTDSKTLKTTSGWYIDRRNVDGNGTDDYGFSTLPACKMPGYEASFWTSTPQLNNAESSIALLMRYNTSIIKLEGNQTGVKGNYSSVRCIKDVNINGETELLVTPSTISIEGVGGKADIIIKGNNTNWSVSSDKTWVNVSKNQGEGESTVSIEVAEATVCHKMDTAIITVKSEYGQISQVQVFRGSKSYPEKCNASDYPQVTIGKQVWMAENYRCSRYDTESEAYSRGKYKTNDALVDVANLNQAEYDNSSIQEEQIKTLGYIYSWNDAVGIEFCPSYKEYDKIIWDYDGCCRQGICPNGWHIPSKEEWDKLIDYVGGKNVAGCFLKSKTGWSVNDYSTENIDKYGFRVLPTFVAHHYSTGFEELSTVNATAVISSSSYLKSLGYDFYNYCPINLLYYSKDRIEQEEGSVSYDGGSLGVVRCLRNTDSDGDYLYVKPTRRFHVKNTGGSIEFDIKTNMQWKIDTDRKWVHSSVVSGEGDSHLNFIVDGTTEMYAKPDTAVVTIKGLNDDEVKVMIFRNGYSGVGMDVTDINGKSYSTIWINGQNWMAENLMCDRYDTESEAFNASWLTNNTISTSKDETYAPYYTDVSDKSKWDNYSKTESGVNLTNEQIAKLGYLYNWAAAVGVADGADQITTFSGNRQGICPNGWHVPSKAELQTLKEYIEFTDGRGRYTAGKHLKTTSGWYWDFNGTDMYGFAVLPAGSTEGSRVHDVGTGVHLQSSTPNPSAVHYSVDAYYWIFNNNYVGESYISKTVGQSVRCLKN